MDTETAIKEIKDRIELESRYRIDVTPDYIEALEMAIDALQKQEPVKPKECHVESMYHGWHYGPVRTKALVHYCPNCGQKLDWTED